MVRVTRADAVPVPLRRLADDALGPDDPDHAGDVPAKLERDREGAVGVTEEVHISDAHFRRSLALLVLADAFEGAGLDARNRATS